MFCKNCGRDIGDAKFCEYCGQPVDAEKEQSDLPPNESAQSTGEQNNESLTEPQINAQTDNGSAEPGQQNPNGTYIPPQNPNGVYGQPNPNAYYGQQNNNPYANGNPYANVNPYGNGNPYGYNQPGQNPYDPYGNPYPNNNDRPSFWWNTLAFLLPIVGLILFFVFKREYPQRAKYMIIWAAVGFVVNVIYTVIDLIDYGYISVLFNAIASVF